MLRATTACTFSKLDISTSKSGPNMVCFVHFDFEMCFAPQRRALFRKSTSEPPKVVRTWCVVHFDFEMCFAPQRRALFRKSTSEPPKVVRDRQFFTLLTWKCASRHNGVHFFDISTSKSGPKLRCFVHFDLDMCFVPQRHALFRHLNSKSGSELRCFVHFDLEMCFAPQRRATFHLSSGQLAPHPPL